MTPTIAQLKQKAQGTVDGISKMSDASKARLPNTDFIEDYNRLRDAVVALSPALAEALPPPVRTRTDEYGLHYWSINYNEIGVYCQQIINMLP